MVLSIELSLWLSFTLGQLLVSTRIQWLRISYSNTRAYLVSPWCVCTDRHLNVFANSDLFFIICLEKENLCLYGHTNETWEVTLPAEEVPPELPEPALGINFARDGMNRRDWLSLVAVHTDSWLLSVAFYFGARLNRNERYIALLLLLMVLLAKSLGLTRLFDFLD